MYIPCTVEVNISNQIITKFLENSDSNAFDATVLCFPLVLLER